MIVFLIFFLKIAVIIKLITEKIQVTVMLGEIISRQPNPVRVMAKVIKQGRKDPQQTATTQKQKINFFIFLFIFLSYYLFNDLKKYTIFQKTNQIKNKP